VLLVVLALACVASVPLAGGRLERLLELRLRARWAALAALALQVAITTFARGGDHGIHVAAHLASYGLAAVFLVANRAIAGLWPIAVGGALNLVAIAANGGVMPASRAALAAAAVPAANGFDNSAALAHAHVAWLGDVIPVPAPLGLGNVLSVGDLIIYAGALLLLHTACRSGAPAAAPAQPQ
jgi:hypothetical protein